MRYKCPECDFPVFNRRVTKCENCGALLPEGLLYSQEQAAAIDAEFEKNKSQVVRFRRGLGISGGTTGDGAADFGGGDFGGCDGGGDCG